jgi:dipeptidyl aminopeptidase/acylaminoacyl peptidase
VELKKWQISTGLLIILTLSLVWLATTDNLLIWPVRNTLQYHLYTWWWGFVGKPQPLTASPGALQGAVYNNRQEPIAGAWVLVSRWDGTTYSTRSDAEGRYRIDGIPPGTYRPVAGAIGYEPVQFNNFFNQVSINTQATTTADAILALEQPRHVSPGRELQLAEPTSLTCTYPFTSQAIRRQIHFISGNHPNQPSFYYTPITATATSQLPILLTVYPGPADSWECASLPLAAAGYVVLATGPAYSFDLETDIDELVRLLAYARSGAFPEGDGRRVALLGGSYSSLHVQRLLQRGEPVQAALLLGPPTDLFDMRRRLENGSYIPPFGLDRALIALGFPDRESLVYWRYSGAYHVRSDFPPLAILHSRSDEVVPYQQSELLVANLAQVQAVYEAHFFEGASHYLLAEDADADTLVVYQLTVDFLTRHLK